MTTTARTLPDSIQVAVPDSWEEFPLDQEEFTRFRRDVTRRLLESDEFGEVGLDRAKVRQLELFLVELHRLAKRERMIFASGYLGIEPAADGDAEGEPTPILIAAAATTVLRSDFDTDMPLLPEVILQAYAVGDSRRAERSEAATDSQAPVSFDHIEPPSVVEVAGLEAVRLLRLMRPVGPAAKGPSQFVESYLFPVAEGDAVIILQFSTVNLDIAKDLSQLFSRIASTIRILYPDDPTFLDDPDPAAPCPAIGPNGEIDLVE